LAVTFSSWLLNRCGPFLFGPPLTGWLRLPFSLRRWRFYRLEFLPRPGSSPCGFHIFKPPLSSFLFVVFFLKHCPPCLHLVVSSLRWLFSSPVCFAPEHSFCCGALYEFLTASLPVFFFFSFSFFIFDFPIPLSKFKHFLIITLRCEPSSGALPTSPYFLPPFYFPWFRRPGPSLGGTLPLLF